MEKLDQLLRHKSSPPSVENERDYERFAQPLSGQLLRSLELNVHYDDALGMWLKTTIHGEERQILDVTGGYGANLLGHKNPHMLQTAVNHLATGESSLTQASERRRSGTLARRLSELLTQETGEGPWFTTLTNSGTEAVDAALKHCLIAYGARQEERRQELQKGANEALLYLNELGETQRAAIIKDWRYRLTQYCHDLKAPQERVSWLLHMASQSLDAAELLDLLSEFNQRQLAERPITFSLERAYHGKTLGSLSLTHNPKYRHPFYVGEESNRFLPCYADDTTLGAIFGAEQLELIEIGLHQIGLYFGRRSISRAAGVFVEPIQGEAGVHAIAADYLALLKKYSLQESFLLVFDEIQAGLYRTGKLASGSHAHVTADVYCFSKTLGAGLAKIGATCFHHKKYCDDFGYLHASTFAEDGYSSRIAIEALRLASDAETLDRGMRAGAKLQQALQDLAERFPNQIKEVRGKGLMLAIELSEKLRDLAFEFAIFHESDMLGYLVASALLHHESIRVTPSLSSNATLRVQPSIYLSDSEINFFLRGLERVLLRLQAADFAYFFQHLYPHAPLSSERGRDLTTTYAPSGRPLSVFLCHLIDAKHIKRVTPAFAPVADEDLEARLALMRRAMEFGVYHAQTLTNEQGEMIDVILLGLPMTSIELKRAFLGKGRRDIIAKVQRGVDLAAELGANTVGLGQFTSIVSGNGLYLDARGMNLTTGNAYTIQLAIEAAEREAAKKAIDLSTASVGLVGAAGNIVSVAAMLMADKAQRLVLVHHTPAAASPKLLRVVRELIETTLADSSDSRFATTLAERLVLGVPATDEDLALWLEKNQDLLCVTHDLTQLNTCSVVITGASSGQGFLRPEHFAPDAVVVDVAVPANIKPEVLEELKRTRRDLSYLLGGVAKLPGDQSLVTPLFPLDTNESFACMAETFAMGFLGKERLLHTGNITKAMVQRARDIARAQGFGLGSTKVKNSL